MLNASTNVNIYINVYIYMYKKYRKIYFHVTTIRSVSLISVST